MTAVHSAMRGELVCSPRIAALLFTRVGAVASKQSGDPDREALTRREHEIVSLVVEGLANKEIARELRIQNATVKNSYSQHPEQIAGSAPRRGGRTRAWNCGKTAGLGRYQHRTDPFTTTSYNREIRRTRTSDSAHQSIIRQERHADLHLCVDRH